MESNINVYKHKYRIAIYHNYLELSDDIRYLESRMFFYYKSRDIITNTITLLNSHYYLLLLQRYGFPTLI